MSLPWDPISDIFFAKVLNQPQPIRREYHHRVKNVEDPVESTEIRIPTADLISTYQTTTT